MFLGGELILEIDIFVRGVSFFFFFFNFNEGCSEDFLYLFFSLLFRYIVIINLVFMLIYILRLLLQFHLSLYVLFLFSLYAHVSYTLYAIFYFYFTLRCRDKFCLKCFRNIGCPSLSCYELSSCKVFQEFVLG